MESPTKIIIKLLLICEISIILSHLSNLFEISFYNNFPKNNVKIKTNTVKPFVQSSLNDRDPFDFGREMDKGYVLGILINLLIF